MKILRHHRGFTTNSSAASEWVWKPPEWAKDGAQDGAQEGEGGETASPGVPQEQGRMVQAADTPQAAPATPLGGNLLVLGGLLLSIVGIFALERMVRRAIRRRRDDDEL